MESWIRQMVFWRQLYITIEDVHILPTIGLHMAEEIKELLMDFLEDTEECPDRRRFNTFIEKIREEFGDVNDVEKMNRMQELLSFTRKPEWAIREFWLRLRRIRLYARQVGVEIPDEIMFTQMLKVLRLSDEQRHLVLTRFETTGIDQNPPDLHRITVKLFGTYIFGAKTTPHVGNGERERCRLR